MSILLKNLLANKILTHNPNLFISKVQLPNCNKYNFSHRHRNVENDNSNVEKWYVHNEMSF